MKIPVISLAIIGGQVFDAWRAAGGDIPAAASRFVSYYTGYEIHTASFRPAHLAIGYVPWLAKRFLLPIARPRIGIRGLPISIS